MPLLGNYARLDRIINAYARQPGQLIRILHQAQEIFGYLPPEVQAYLAAKLNVPLAEIAGVVSFYSLFNSEPKGQFTISVCLGTACYVKGGDEVFQAFKRELGLDDDDTTPDRTFTLRSTRCRGACGLAPVVAVNDDIFGQVEPDKVGAILSHYRKLITQTETETEPTHERESKRQDHQYQPPREYQEAPPSPH